MKPKEKKEVPTLTRDQLTDRANHWVPPRKFEPENPRVAVGIIASMLAFLCAKGLITEDAAQGIGRVLAASLAVNALLVEAGVEPEIREIIAPILLKIGGAIRRV